MIKTLKKLLVIVAAVIMLTAMITATAFAAGDPEVTITGNTLDGGAITFADFAGVTLNGQQQTTTSTWTIGDIIDSRGTGEGWHLSLTLAQLSEYDTDHYVPSGHTIPTSSITVSTAPTITEADGTSSPAGVIAMVPVSTALDTGLPVKLLIAEAGEGMGSYDIGDITATLTIRADAYATTYKTAATVALVTGP